MIVKNELKHIENCLAALRPLRSAIPCQVVIADTGSTDGTREIAAAQADEFFDFVWQDDFSAARNAVMDRCNGVWFLSVDADEYLEPDFEQLLEFLREPPSQDCEGARVCIRSYTHQSDPGRYRDFFVERLVRMDSGVRYTGAVHELLDTKQMPHLLDQVVFDHYGYILDDPKSQAEKRQRNMPALEQELKRDVYNIRRIVQCVESARDEAESLKYVRRGLRVVEQGKAKEAVWIPLLYRYAVEAGSDLEQTLAWLAEAEQRYPDSLFIRIDALAVGLLRCYREDRYEEAADYGIRWRENCAAYRAGALDKTELCLSTLQYEDAHMSVSLRCILFDCLGKTGAWEMCAQVLEEIELERLDQTTWVTLVRAFFNYCEHLDNLLPQLQRLWDLVCACAGEGRESWAENKAFLKAALEMQFPVNGGAAVGLQAVIARMDGEPGRSARILRADAQDTIAAELAGIVAWEDVLYPVYPHVMAHALDFPAGFYLQTPERLAELAATLPKYTQSLRDDVLSYQEGAPEAEPPIRLAWQLDVTIAALRTEAWTVCDERHGVLCTLFARQSEAYLSRVYHPDLLNASCVSVLPGMHRMAWYYLQARQRMCFGDEHGYVQYLRAGLETAPAMKGMVDYLIGELERRQQEERRRAISEATPELVTLAEQVRGILAAYPADDPAVQALKQSPAYQKVAFLIEEPASQFRM